MTYVMYSKKTAAEMIKQRADQTSYRHLSQQIKESYPNAKMSTAKIWRIANQKQEMSASDVALFMNYFNLDWSDFFMTFAF